MILLFFMTLFLHSFSNDKYFKISYFDGQKDFSAHIAHVDGIFLFYFLNHFKGQKEISVKKGHVAFKINECNLIIFGGSSCIELSKFGARYSPTNDIWKYDFCEKNYHFLTGNPFSSSEASFNLTHESQCLPSSSQDQFPFGLEFLAGYYDKKGENLVIFGGNTKHLNRNVMLTNQMWVYSLKSDCWMLLRGSKITFNEPVSLSSNPERFDAENYPPSLYGHSMLLSPLNSSLCVLFGGGGFVKNDSSMVNFFNGLFVYDSKQGLFKSEAGSYLYQEEHPKGTKGKFSDDSKPAGSFGTVIFFHPSKSNILFIFGGNSIVEDTPRVSNNLFAYDFSKKQFGLISGLTSAEKQKSPFPDDAVPVFNHFGDFFGESENFIFFGGGDINGQTTNIVQMGDILTGKWWKHSGDIPSKNYSPSCSNFPNEFCHIAGSSFVKISSTKYLIIGGYYDKYKGSLDTIMLFEAKEKTIFEKEDFKFFLILGISVVACVCVFICFCCIFFIFLLIILCFRKKVPHSSENEFSSLLGHGNPNKVFDWINPLDSRYIINKKY